MRRYLLVAPANPHLRLLTVDMLKSWNLSYRGDLTLMGPAAQDHATLPWDKALLCIDADRGTIYRPEGDGTVTYLGNAIEHCISRPVLNAVYHGDAAPLIFTTEQETLLRRAMERAKIEPQAIKDALYGKAVSLFEPDLARVLCEALRLVCDYNLSQKSHPGHVKPVALGEILTTVKVDRSTASAAA